MLATNSKADDSASDIYVFSKKGAKFSLIKAVDDIAVTSLSDTGQYMAVVTGRRAVGNYKIYVSDDYGKSFHSW